MNKKITGINLKDGIYIIDKKYSGVRIRGKFKNKKSAEDYIKLKIEEIENRKDSIDENYKIVQISFKQLFIEFSKYQIWDEITKKKITNRFDNYLNIDCNDVFNLSNEKVINTLQKLRDNYFKHLYKLDYANRLISLLEKIIKFGKEYNYINKKFNVNFSKYKIRGKEDVEQKTKDNFLVEDEVNLLEQGILKYDKIPGTDIIPEDLIFAYKFLFYTGLRIGEARAVRFCDIKKENGYDGDGQSFIYHYVLINKQMEDNSQKIIYHSKTKVDRNCIISNECFDLVRKHFSSKKHKYDVKDHIFRFLDDNVISRKTLSRAIKRTIKFLKTKGDLPSNFNEDLSPHGFRYSNTLYLNEKDFDVKFISDNQGHSVSQTLNVYRRADRTQIFKMAHLK